MTVDLRRISNDGRKHWYYADVTCSNWGELKPSKMLQTYQEMENSVGSKIKVCKERVSLGNIYSGNDCYEVYTSLKSVYKNKDVIYKGYVPSMSAPKHGSSSASSKIDEIPQESKNALSRAERYYHDMDLSKSQVRKQLEYEGYEKDAIDYAMKNLT